MIPPFCERGGNRCQVSGVREEKEKDEEKGIVPVFLKPET
jgi:hypothetical protein